MPSRRSEIKYMVNIYITAHGRADTEDLNQFKLTQRDIYIGQEVGNCSIQEREYDENLLHLITNWNKEREWLATGAKIGFIESDDYQIGRYRFEDETKVKFETKGAIVGPKWSKLDKVIDLDGRPDENSRPGVIIIIQEYDKLQKTNRKATVRHIMNKIYTRDDELGIDKSEKGHRFTAIFKNDVMIEPNENTKDNILSLEFYDDIRDSDELKLSEIINKSKYVASKMIGLKPNNKQILYTIADTTCNVYSSEDITASPNPDQNEEQIYKSSKKAKELSNLIPVLLDKNSFDSSTPKIASVTPGHGSDWWYSGTESRLRMRPGDKPIMPTNVPQSLVTRSSHSNTSSHKPFISNIKRFFKLPVTRNKRHLSRHKKTHKRRAKHIYKNLINLGEGTKTRKKNKRHTIKRR